MSNVLSSKTLYVVDDTSFMRAGLIKVLIEFGFEKSKIQQFENGAAALSSLMAGQNPPDLILCDWNMPVMTGIDFLRQVRGSDGGYKTVPFVLITTESERDKVVEALKYKISGYILKPLDNERLKEVIENVFSVEGSD